MRQRHWAHDPDCFRRDWEEVKDTREGARRRTREQVKRFKENRARADTPDVLAVVKHETDV